MKALGGFYYVKTAQTVYECKARGLFRKQKITPYVGDRVIIEITDEQHGYLLEIEKRKNMLIRPPVANIDLLFIVVSMMDPAPNTLVIDKMLAIAEMKEITPVIVITKTDLKSPTELEDIYRQAGFVVHTVDNTTGAGIEAVKQSMQGNICAFCGNSGAGKTSLLNNIDAKLSLATADISKKLGRGRHTTRHVELFALENGGYVADTPGFSAIDLERTEVILKDQLQYCFREFEPYLYQCKFTGCSHTTEKGCAVLKAVAEGKIAKSRHDSYLSMYEMAKNIKEWELTKEK